jgi:hypothetical protein
MTDKTGADEWETTSGGSLVARGVGTPPTGYGFDLILIDDPVKKRERRNHPSTATSYGTGTRTTSTRDLSRVGRSS